jgi:hypothetical protein
MCSRGTPVRHPKEFFLRFMLMGDDYLHSVTIDDYASRDT